MSHDQDFEIYDSLERSGVFFHLTESKSSRFFILSLFFMLLVFIVFIFTVEVEEWVDGIAVIRPVNEVISVKNVIQGNIFQVEVKHGDAVEKGQLLWVNDNAEQKAQLEHLRANKNLLEQALSEKQSVFTVLYNNGNPENLNQNAQAIYQSIKLDLDRLELEKNYALNKWENIKSLPETLIQNERKEDLLYNYQIAQNSFDQYLVHIYSNLNNEIIDLKNNVSRISLEVIAVEKIISDSEVRAPISGIVEYERSISVGDFVNSMEPMIRIIPELNHKELHISIPEKALKEVQLGQKIILRFNGVSEYKYGHGKGVITYVPDDVIINQNGFTYSVFRGELESDEFVSKNGDVVLLKTGMTAQARIQVDKDTIINVFLKKLEFI